jgi:hypothetical protein
VIIVNKKIVELSYETPRFEKEGLSLECSPEQVQIMPPQAKINNQVSPLKIIGNTITGFLLLGGLLSAPFWLAGFLTIY